MRCTQVVNVIGLSVVLCYFCFDGVRAFVQGPQSPPRILRRPDAAVEVIPLLAAGISQPSFAFDSGGISQPFFGDDFSMARTVTVLAVLFTMQLVLARPARAFFSIKTKKKKEDTSRRDIALAVGVAGLGFVGLQQLSSNLDFEEEVPPPLTPADKKQKEVVVVTEKRFQVQKDSQEKNVLKMQRAQEKREEKSAQQMKRFEEGARREEEKKKKVAAQEEEEERLKQEDQSDPLSEILQFGILVGGGATFLMKEKVGGKAVDEDSDSEENVSRPEKARDAVSPPPRMPDVTEVPQRATRPAKQLRKI